MWDKSGPPGTNLPTGGPTAPGKITTGILLVLLGAGVACIPGGQAFGAGLALTGIGVMATEAGDQIRWM